jgi:TPR repeat protein
MTFELLPMATRQMQSDQDAASPLYENGLSAIFEGKSEEAVTLLIGASELGHVEAQYRLAELYLDGSLLPVNHDEAGHWIQRASDQGDHRAQIRLGWMYEAGLGFKTDHELPRDYIVRNSTYI